MDNESLYDSMISTIQNQCKLKKISLTKLADESGVPMSTLSRNLKGHAEMSLKTFLALGKVLKLNKVLDIYENFVIINESGLDFHIINILTQGTVSSQQYTGVFIMNGVPFAIGRITGDNLVVFLNELERLTINKDTFRDAVNLTLKSKVEVKDILENTQLVEMTIQMYRASTLNYENRLQ